MQESRLFQIMYYLMEKGHATAPELAAQFEVSVRTIYRDIDALSNAGIPLYTETGRNGGIYIMKGFTLDKTLLSETEKLNILTSLQSLNATGQFENSGILHKLSAIFQSVPANWLEVDFSRWGNRSEDNEKFEQLKSAVLSHHSVWITYANSAGITNARKIYPLKLSYKSRSWYLKAFCESKQDYRLFKLSRILSLTISEEMFSCDNLPVLPTEQETSSIVSSDTILLRFPGEMAYRVFDEFGQSEISFLENGDLMVSAHMPEDTWLTGFLLSFGTQVEILAPLRLKALVAEQAEKIYQKNKP